MLLISLSLGLIIVFLINITHGAAKICLNDFFNIWSIENSNDTIKHIILNFRLPKAINAVLVGSALGISGLLMQTFFKNPLAGPYVLGINSGASFGIALCILGGQLIPQIHYLLLTKWTYTIAASLGSLLVLLIVMSLSIKVKDSMSLLIVGIMFSSITSGIVSILSFFASAEALQQYVFWGFGNISKLSWSETQAFCAIVIVGIIISFYLSKCLNSLQLGEFYAKSLGQYTQKHRFLIITVTSILCGSVTAFAGPIAFIGLAIPHLSKLIFKTSNHSILILGCIFLGSILMLSCDYFSQLPSDGIILPINAITAIVGAPMVIFLLLKSQKIIH